jgi:hypothetical protein
LHYAVNEDTGLFAEETAKVFGVPFELVPFKERKGKEQGPAPRPPMHIFSVPKKSELILLIEIKGAVRRRSESQGGTALGGGREPGGRVRDLGLSGGD